MVVEEWAVAWEEWATKWDMVDSNKINSIQCKIKAIIKDLIAA